MAESEQDAYQELVKATQDGNSIVDFHTMLLFEDYVRSGKDANTLAAPMLARIRTSGLEEIKKHATVLSITGNIISLLATPEQLLELMKMNAILSFEGSREGGSFEE